MDINSIPPISTKMTSEQFYALPEDGKRYELIEGEVDVAPSPSMEHQRLSIRLAYALMKYFERKPVGEVLTAPMDVELDAANVYQPDLIVVLEENSRILTKARVVGAPDLIVEILSSGTAMKDRNVKLQRYAKAGVREAWLADPARRRFEIYRLRDDKRYAHVETVEEGGTLTTPMLPGLRIKVARLFME